MKKYLSMIIALLELIVGTALTAAPFAFIIIPQGFLAGGVTGFSKILTSVLPMPLSLMVLLINLLLLFIGLIFVGRQFVAKTITVSLLFPMFLELFSRYPVQSLAKDPLFSALVAGVTLGLGAGLVLRSGASSGGFDILAVALNKRFKLPVALTMNICDALVIFCFQ